MQVGGRPETERSYIQIHTWLIHIAVQQKLSQHGKGIVPHLKRNKNTLDDQKSLPDFSKRSP